MRAFTCPHLQAKLFPGGARGRQVTRVVEGTLVEWVSGNMLVARHARHLHHDEYTEFLHWPALGGRARIKNLVCWRSSATALATFPTAMGLAHGHSAVTPAGGWAQQRRGQG